MTRTPVHADAPIPASPLFGERLRALRIAARLTQAELAARSGVSLRTISDLERGARRTPQAEPALMLAGALGLTGADRDRFLRAVREERAPRRKHAPSGGPLPPAALLLGREELVEGIVAAVRGGARLLTLTGPAGVGKSAVARESAARLAAAGPWLPEWIPLQREDAPERLLAAVAETLHVPLRPDVPPGMALRDALAGRRTLLVLDGMDRLAPAAPEIASLLDALPGLAVIATSREAPRLSRERAMAIPPLPAPAREASRGDLLASPAVQIVLRAAGAGPEPDPHDLAAAGEAARMLEGSPLALELAGAAAAAGGLRLVPELIERAGIAALAHGPQDGASGFPCLEEAIAWTADRLPGSARALLPLLAAFEGGFTPEAAAEVAGMAGEPRAAAGLPALAHAGLAVVEGGRYRLPATARLFAAERLRRSGVERAARDAHARWFGDWARWRADAIQGEYPGPALAEIDEEFPNLRAAASWFARHGDGDGALSIAVSIGSWLDIRGRFSEGRALVDGALAAANGHCDLDLLASALFWSGQAAAMQSDREMAQARVSHLRGLAGPAGAGGWNSGLEALALLLESSITGQGAGIGREGVEVLRRAHALLPAGTASFARWAVCLRLGVELAQAGDPAAALPLLEEALAIAEARKRLVEKPVPLVQHGLALVELGRLDEAAPELAAGLAIARSLDLHVVGFLALLCAARLLALRGRPADGEAAARALAGALAGCRRDGIEMSGFWETRNRETRAILSGQLGEAALKQAEAATESAPIAETSALARTALLQR